MVFAVGFDSVAGLGFGIDSVVDLSCFDLLVGFILDLVLVVDLFSFDLTM